MGIFTDWDIYKDESNNDTSFPDAVTALFYSLSDIGIGKLRRREFEKDSKYFEILLHRIESNKLSGKIRDKIYPAFPDNQSEPLDRVLFRIYKHEFKFNNKTYLFEWSVDTYHDIVYYNVHENPELMESDA